jgi:hypothetical protein
MLRAPVRRRRGGGHLKGGAVGEGERRAVGNDAEKRAHVNVRRHAAVPGKVRNTRGR